MRVKLFTFRYSVTLGGFDDSPLADFVRDKEVLSFREYFFVASEMPHLVCILIWQDAVVGEAELEAARQIRRQPEPDPTRAPLPGPRAERPPRSGRRAAPDPTAGLDERDRALFNTLREWRTAKAREEGVPPYLVFTNRHLLEVVASRPESPNALGHLHGIGPGKVKRYGEKLLALVNGAPPAGVNGGQASEKGEASRVGQASEEDVVSPIEMPAPAEAAQ